MEFFIFLSNTGIQSSSVEGHSWGWICGGMHLFSKLWKTSHFLKNPQIPKDAQRLSFQNWTASVHLENLQGASRFLVLMFATSSKRKCRCLHFSLTLNYIHIWIFTFWWIADHNASFVPWKKWWAFFFPQLLVQRAELNIFSQHLLIT